MEAIRLLCLLILSVCLPTPILSRVKHEARIRYDQSLPSKLTVLRWRRDTAGGSTASITNSSSTPAPVSGTKSQGNKTDSGTSDEDASARVNVGGARPPWALKGSTAKKAPIKSICPNPCKKEPAVGCSEPNQFDPTVIRIKGPNSMCCKTYKCFNEDGSYYTFNGLQGVVEGSFHATGSPQPGPGTMNSYGNSGSGYSDGNSGSGSGYRGSGSGYIGSGSGSGYSGSNNGYSGSNNGYSGSNSGY